MRVFVTGASGFIGAALVPELLGAGHQVLGLVRSDAGAKSVAAAGAQVHRGDLNDLESLRSGAAQSDAVIHTAFNHDFSKFKENCETDRSVIEALASAVAGSDRPLIITSGTAMATPGRVSTEQDPPVNSRVIPRAASEEAAAAAVARGCRAMVLRLSQIHDPRKQGLVTYAIQIARQKGLSAYIGEGLNRWPAAHVSDTARLYRLVLEKGQPGATYNAVAEEGITLRDIAEVIGKGLNVPVVSLFPEKTQEHFGWLAHFVGLDIPASSALTQQRLGWRPTGPGLIADLQKMNYSEPETVSTAGAH
jgi:nucleoside-diphosphate-sugar epimerase